MSVAPLKRAIEKAGGPSALGRMLGITSAAVSQWDQVPPLRVLDVERVTGIARHELRPDLYPMQDASPQPERAAS